MRAGRNDRSCLGNSPLQNRIIKANHRFAIIDFGGFIMNIFMWILIFIGGATGAVSTLYIIVSLFAVLFYKIYRKITCHASLYD